MSRSSAQGLSVCCLTNDDPSMVATILGSFRGVADEIVVAVDSRVDPARLGSLADVADTVVRFEYIHPPERARPWLVQLCHHQAVLMIDGDEVPSTALLAQLPALAADDTFAQCRLARRWTFPDERRWLAERPWWPDYQRRLIRVGPDLDFDLRVHGGVRPALPVRLVDAPLYHLILQLVPISDRRARARIYEADRPGMVAVGGGPMNDTLYVPEHFATLRPEPTPPEDLTRLRDVLDAVRAGAQQGPGPAIDGPIVTAAEIAAHQPVDPLENHGYRARLRIAEVDCRTDPGGDTLVAIEVINDMAVALPSRDTRGLQVRVAARLLDAQPQQAALPWALTPLPCEVPPGESRLAEVLVRVPDGPGSYVLEVNLVNERGRWFDCATHADMLVSTRWGRFTPGTL